MQSRPESSDIGPGAMIDGKFRVERVLGMGGMGLVVEATHLALDRRVALKFLRPNRSDAHAIERILREARAAARLRSQHVARVLDVARAVAPSPGAGLPYIVMEHLEGRDLAAILRGNGPLPIGDAAGFVLQACEAIAEAHAHGIVHRDLKPENLFLTTRVDGRPLIKVLDFGISKLTALDGAEAMALTRTADLMGSPSYMSPEQLRHARNVDARTDQWSLGVILFELFTGRLPFPATTIMELCARVLEGEPPPVASLRPDVPPELAAAVLRCLQKDPAHRFAGVADLAAALEPFATGAERGAAERIRQVSLGAAPRGRLDSTAGERLGGSGTAVSWAETQFGISVRRRPRAWIAAAIVTTVLLAALVSLLRLRGPSAPSGAAPSAEPLELPDASRPRADASVP